MPLQVEPNWLTPTAKTSFKYIYVSAALLRYIIESYVLANPSA